METQYISLNMTPMGVNPCFHISQYDVGRMLGFIVHSGGATVDLDTYTCTIEATRSDGTAITSAVATTDNIGTFEVTPTMSNKADKYRCQLIIVDENSKRIASLPFDMEVTKAAMDENSESIEEDASLYQQYTEAVQGAIAEANADIQAEENARIAAVNAEATARQNADATLQNNIDAEATARQSADNTLQGNINSEASTRASADSNLQSQINQIVAPSGEAPSAAEVQNARIGADGVTYDTLGNAIRTQIGNLDNAFKSDLTNGKSGFELIETVTETSVANTYTNIPFVFLPDNYYLIDFQSDTSFDSDCVLGTYAYNTYQDNNIAKVSKGNTKVVFLFTPTKYAEYLRVQFSGTVRNYTLSIYAYKENKDELRINALDYITENATIASSGHFNHVSGGDYSFILRDVELKAGVTYDFKFKFDTAPTGSSCWFTLYNKTTKLTEFNAQGLTSKEISYTPVSDINLYIRIGGATVSGTATVTKHGQKNAVQKNKENIQITDALTDAIKNSVFSDNIIDDNLMVRGIITDAGTEAIDNAFTRTNGSILVDGTIIVSATTDIYLWVCAWKNDVFTKIPVRNSSVSNPFVIIDKSIADYIRILATRVSGTTLTDAYELNQYISVFVNHDKIVSDSLLELAKSGNNIGNNLNLKSMHSGTRFDSDYLEYSSAVFINNNENIQYSAIYKKNGAETELGYRKGFLFIEDVESFKIMFRHIDGTVMDYKEIHSDFQVVVYKKAIPYQYIENSTAIEIANSLINGLKMRDQINNSFVDLKELSAKRTQVPSLTIVDDIVYATFVTNYNTTIESPEDFVLKLCVFPLSDPTNITRYTVSETGMTITGIGKMAAQLDSLVYYDGNGNIIIVFNGKIENGITSNFYRIFNIATATFTESGICTFSAGAYSDDFSITGVNNVLTSAGIKHIAPTNTAALIVTMRITTRTENGETWYYSGLGEEGRFNAIIKTKNFKDWVYVATPPFDNNALYEPIVYVEGNYAYYFCRQTPQTGYSFFTRYNLITDYWEDPVYFPDASSKADIISFGNYLFLINSPVMRSHIAVYLIDKNYLNKTVCLQVARFDGGAYYTANFNYDNTLYSIIPQNNLNMMFGSYSINSISREDILDKFAKLFADLL